MTYKECIDRTMIVLDHLLRKGFKFKKNEFNNPCKLDIDRGGFFASEDAQKGYTYGRKQVNVSPLYVIDILFGNSNGEIIEEPIVSKTAGALAEGYFLDPISYSELVNPIDSMRNTSYTGTILEGCIDPEYDKFIKRLNELKFKGCSLVGASVLELRNLSYEGMINIDRTNKPLARRLERMFQVESQLTRYCKQNIAGFDEDDVASADDVDLSKHYVSWEDFCRIILHINSAEIAQDNFDYKNCNHIAIKMVPLGLDELYLPATPKAYTLR